MTAERKYHHGNLKEAFLDVARALLETDGLAGLSLRKCAEKVGVSHTAPKNHFGNMAGLLTAIVTKGYSELAQMMVAEVSECAAEKLSTNCLKMSLLPYAMLLSYPIAPIVLVVDAKILH